MIVSMGKDQTGSQRDLNGISIYNVWLHGLELYELMVIDLIHLREQKIKHLESNSDIVVLTGR